MSDNTKPNRAYDASQFEPARRPLDLLVGPAPRHAAPCNPCRVNVAALLSDIKRRLNPRQRQDLDDVIDVVKRDAADAGVAEGYSRGITVTSALVPRQLLDALIAGAKPGDPPVYLTVDKIEVAVTLTALAPNLAPDAARVWSHLSAAVRGVANSRCQPDVTISKDLPPEVALVTYTGKDGRTVQIAARGAGPVLRRRDRRRPSPPWKGGAAGFIPVIGGTWGAITAGGTAVVIGAIVASAPAVATPHRTPDAGGSMLGRIPQAASATRGRHPLRSPVTVARPPTLPAAHPTPDPTAPAQTPRTTPAPSGGPTTPPPPAPTPAQSPTAQPPAGDPDNTAPIVSKKPKRRTVRRRRHEQATTTPSPSA